MNRKQELAELFNLFKDMIVTVHTIGQKYLAPDEEPISLEDQLILDLMFRDLGWKDTEDFLNGFGVNKVILITVPEEEE